MKLKKGILLRQFQERDKAAFLKLANQYFKQENHLRGEDIPSLLWSNPEQQFFQNSSFNPFTDIFLVDGPGNDIGFACYLTEHYLQRAIGYLFLHPSWRHQGIGRLLLQELEREVARKGLKYLHFCLPERNKAGQFFLAENGYHPVRRFLELTLDLTDNQKAKRLVQPLPDNLGLTHFKPGDEAGLVALQNKVFLGSWGFNPNNEAEIKYYLNLMKARLEEVLVLYNGSQPIGYLWPHYLWTAQPVRARIHMFGLLREWRRRGWGKILFEAGLNVLRQRGVLRVDLVVDETNRPAVKLYQRQGFVLKTKLNWWEKDLESSPGFLLSWKNN
jgi:ribosomal protein S18 acetylase RimI-like enzyme